MLNRLFIVVGLIAIAAIIAGFAAPYFIDWTQYRDRMEFIASETLGTTARVTGKIEVALLPQPRVKFDDVEIGPPSQPLVKIGTVEANFSLLDFLRDRYTVTQLVLKSPELFIDIGPDGKISAPVHLAQSARGSNVSIADADIIDGTVRLTDLRLEQGWALTDFTGKLQMAGLRGPFSLQGQTDFQSGRYDLRLNTSSMNAEGAMQATGFVRPLTGDFSLALEGLLSTDDAIRFSGSALYRQAPTQAEKVEQAKGDLVMTAKVEADSEQILFSDYLIVLDENRPIARLTGAAAIHLGAEPNFDAVLSGGVVALTQRDAREENTDQPYEFLRLIDELPAPLLPPLPGRIGLDVTELGLRAFSMREVRLDAKTDGEAWTVSSLTARLPGNSVFSFVGNVAADAGHPVVDGAMTLDSARLDTLALLWRKVDDVKALFNMPGSLAGRIALDQTGLTLSDGRFTLDGVENSVDLQISTKDQRTLALTAHLGTLSDPKSAALRALVPDIAAGSGFSTSFSSGKFDLAADSMVIADLDGEMLEAKGTWAADQIDFDRIAARDLGGARFAFSGTYASADQAAFSGEGTLSLSDAAEEGAVASLLTTLGAPEQIKTSASAILPAELKVTLSPLTGDGAQLLDLRGRVGSAEGEANIRFGDGIENFSKAPITLDTTLKTRDVGAVMVRLGLPELSPVNDGDGASFSLHADGTMSNSIGLEMKLTGGDDEISFSGDAVVSNLNAPRGKGKLTFALSDVTPLMELLGAEGIAYSGAQGAADMSFTGNDVLTLSNIDAETGGAFISGDLNRSRQGTSYQFGGQLRASEIDVTSLSGLLGGAGALLPGDGLWPEGPLSTGAAIRATRGRIAIAAPRLSHSGRQLGTDLAFDFSWDDTNIRLRSLSLALGGGILTFEAGACCAGAALDQQITGRLGLADVNIDALFPDEVAKVLDGRIDGGARFTATGASYRDILAKLNGEGSFTLRDFSVAEFDPAAFETVAAIENILELSPEALTAQVEAALKGGKFISPEVGGVFSLTGGALRLSNLAAEGQGARLLGDTVLNLVDLGLSGAWILTPSAGLANSATSQVTAVLSGTLLDPQYQLDLGPMIDAIKVRAYEIEVDRLEKLRAEEEARAKVAAEERAKLMEEQARQKAEEEARKAAEEAARQKRSQQDREALDLLLQDLGQSGDPLLNQDDSFSQPPVDLVPSPFATPDPIFSEGG